MKASGFELCARGSWTALPNSEHPEAAGVGSGPPALRNTLMEDHTRHPQLRHLNQFLLRPNLDGLDLLGSLGLNAVGVQKDLQSRERERNRVYTGCNWNE